MEMLPVFLFIWLSKIKVGSIPVRVLPTEHSRPRAVPWGQMSGTSFAKLYIQRFREHLPQNTSTYSLVYLHICQSDISLYFSRCTNAYIFLQLKGIARLKLMSRKYAQKTKDKIIFGMLVPDWMRIACSLAQWLLSSSLLLLLSFLLFWWLPRKTE